MCLACDWTVQVQVNDLQGPSEVEPADISVGCISAYFYQYEIFNCIGINNAEKSALCLCTFYVK